MRKITSTSIFEANRLIKVYSQNAIECCAKKMRNKLWNILKNYYERLHENGDVLFDIKAEKLALIVTTLHILKK
jgi:hypothetical protein